MNFKFLVLGLSLTIMSSSLVVAAESSKKLELKITKNQPTTKSSRSDQVLDSVTRAANRLMVKGKNTDAIKLYRRAINQNPGNKNALAGLGIAYGKLFKLDAADEQFDKALDIDPHFALAYAGKAMVLLNRLQSPASNRNRDTILKQAESLATQAVIDNSKLAESHYSLGLVYREQGLLNESMQEFLQAISLDKKFSEAYSALGLVCIVKSDLPSAEANFKHAIEFNSGNSTAHYGLGRIYLKKNQIDDAIKELNISLYQNSNSSPTHEALGAAYEAQGNNVAAVKEYQESIRVRAESPQAYIRIADIRLGRGDIEHSIAELRSGLEIFPENPELHLWVADQSLRLNKCDDAIDEYVKVLQLDPENKDAGVGLTRAYYVKFQQMAPGVFLSTSGTEKADKLVGRLVELKPSDVELRLAQTKLHMLMGKPFSLDQTTEPKNDAERISYAEALLTDHKIDQATDQIRKVVDHLTTSKQLFAVGDLALMIHDLDGAEAAYKKAATMPDAEERAKRSLGLVSTARDEAAQDLIMANDLAAKKQLPSAVAKYKMAIFENPALPDAHLGMAKALEQVAPNSLEELKKAKLHYQIYLSLTKDLSEKDMQKLTKHIEMLDSKTYKLSEDADADIHKDHKSTTE